MCGIVGYSGKNKFDQNKIKILMLSNIVRGVDATGFYNDKKITKDIVSAEKFLGTASLVPENIFVGHTRKGTSGKNIIENAHPFQRENIIGVHNGGITYRYQIEKFLNVGVNDYSVDSELIFIALSQAKFVQMMDKFEGAAALIWVDVNFPDRLYFFHNEERPLFYGMYNKETMYLSSIKESLLTIGCKEQSIVDVPIDKVFVVENGVILEDECYDVPHTSSKVTTTTSHNYGSGSTYKSHLFSPGDYVTTLYKISGFTYGKEYIVEKTTYYDIDVRNDNGKLVSVRASDFKEVEKPKEGEFAKLRFDVSIEGSENKLYTTDVLRVNRIDKTWDPVKREHNYKASCLILNRDIAGNRIFTMPSRYIRKVSYEESTSLNLLYGKKKESKQLDLWENSYYTKVSSALDSLSMIKSNLDMVAASISSNFMVYDIMQGDLDTIDSTIKLVADLEDDIQNNVDYFSNEKES